MASIDFNNSLIQVVIAKIEDGELKTQGMTSKVTKDLWENKEGSFDKLVDEIQKTYDEFGAEAIDSTKSAIQLSFANIVDGKLVRTPVAVALEKWSKDELVKAKDMLNEKAKELNA